MLTATKAVNEGSAMMRGGQKGVDGHSDDNGADGHGKCRDITTMMVHAAGRAGSGRLQPPLQAPLCETAPGTDNEVAVRHVSGQCNSSEAKMQVPVPSGTACSSEQESALVEEDRLFSGPLLHGPAVKPQVDRATAAAAWQQIHKKMKPPKCGGHKEDCVIREVKKPGPNKGKRLGAPMQGLWLCVNLQPHSSLVCGSVSRLQRRASLVCVILPALVVI